MINPKDTAVVLNSLMTHAFGNVTSSEKNGFELLKVTCKMKATCKMT